ncbi:MAG: head GIN domain-containing protein [Bacteroidales bacterium]
MNARVLTLLMVATLSVLFTSCYKTDYFPCVKARGGSVEEIRITGAFDAIDLRLHARVFVSLGEEAQVRVMAPLNILDLIQTSTSGKTLTIDNARCISNRADEIKIYITTPSLSSLRIAGSGHIVVEDFLEAEVMNADIAGSGKIVMEGNFQRFNSSISGSGDVIVKGFARQVFAQISGSGTINALDMHSSIADVRISGSGCTKVAVEDQLTVRIAGSGNVYYLGDPAIQVNITGSGKLIRL